jgi:hypothetical protein
VIDLVITSTEVRAIYSDELLPYIRRLRAHFGLPESAIRVQRASHVEPTKCGTWYVDLNPVGGDIVYVDEEGRPFDTRQSALDYEVAWLRANWLLNGDSTDASSQPKEE